MGGKWKFRKAQIRALGSTFSAVTWVRIGLGVLAASLLVFLLLAKKPWGLSTVPRDSFKVGDLVVIYLWIAAAINLGLTALLLATVGFWMRPVAEREDPPRPTTPRWFWPLVLLAMTIVAVCAMPRLNDSFWDDEEYNVRHSIWGRFKTGDDPGTYRFRKLGWEDTFFDYREPNNHVLHSLLARSSLTIWQKVSPSESLPFTEWPLRVPAWLFGILGVATLAWFLKDAGFAGAGVVAAFLMALHPWVIRYASEMRGYSMVMALLPVALVFWRRAHCEGTWRWWLAYAGVQWAILYTYPGVLFTFCFLNILGLALLAFSSAGADPFRIQWRRWVVANMLAGMAVLQCMLPLYPQVEAYFIYLSERGFVVGWPWFQLTFALTLAGTPWVGVTDAHPALMTQWGDHPVGLALVIALAGVLTLVGIFRFLRCGWKGAVVVVSVFVPPVLTVGLSIWKTQMIYSSYVIYALPGLIAFAALGVWVVAIWLRTRPVGRVTGAAWVMAILIAYAILTQPTRAWLMSHPLQQIKESVLACRGSLNPAESPDTLTASFCIPPYIYDPLLVRLDSVRELREMMRRADAENRFLVLNIGMPWAAQEYSPQMWALMQDKALFVAHQRLLGFDSGLDRIIATYRPGSAAQFDFSGYEDAGR